MERASRRRAPLRRPPRDATPRGPALDSSRCQNVTAENAASYRSLRVRARIEYFRIVVFSRLKSDVFAGRFVFMLCQRCGWTVFRRLCSRFYVDSDVFMFDVSLDSNFVQVNMFEKFSI